MVARRRAACPLGRHRASSLVDIELLLGPSRVVIGSESLVSLVDVVRTVRGAMIHSEAGVMGSVGQTTVAGRYRLLALVASGGMGRVWRAHDELLDREVAIKELTAPAGMPVIGRREVQFRTVREARAAARLDHPGVVRIFDVVQATGRSWIVMEYIPSRSLQQVISEDGPLTHQEAARVGLAVLSALTAAHAAGVLHLDVKPHNVLIAADRRIVLTDFGLATVSAAPGSSTVSVDGEPLLGSPHYVAPERLRGAAGDARMDLWSLGASLYAAVESRPPFDRPSITESLAAVLVDAPDPPRHPGPLHPVIAGLLAADPARRWGAAKTMAALSALTRRAVGVVSVPAPRRPTHDAVRFRPAAVTVASTPRRSRPAGRWSAAPPGPAAPEPTAAHAPAVATPTRSLRLRIALAGVAVIAAAAPVVVWQASGEGPARPASDVAAEPTAATACAGAAPQPVTDGRDPAPYALPDGWLWHVDPAAFALPVPRTWTRAVNADVVCFTDPDGARTLTVQPGPALTGEPLRHWQAAEQQALANGTLPGYRKVSMGVLLVTGGGADWEYTWQPPTGPRLHTYRVLRSAGARSHLLTWTTPDNDWDLNQTHRRITLDGVRDRSASPSPWAVPAPLA